MKKRNPRIGSSLDDFLKEEGILEETRTLALKETIAWQIQQAMKMEKINKVEMGDECTRAGRHLIAIQWPATALNDILEQKGGETSGRHWLF